MLHKEVPAPWWVRPCMRGGFGGAPAGGCRAAAVLTVIRADLPAAILGPSVRMTLPVANTASEEARQTPLPGRS